MNLLHLALFFAANAAVSYGAKNLLRINGTTMAVLPANIVTEFQTNARIADGGVFASPDAFKNDDGTVLKDMTTADHAYVLLVFLTAGFKNPSGGNFAANNWYADLDAQRASQWGRSLTKNHVSYAARSLDHGCGIFLANMFQYIPHDSLGSLTTECWEKILESPNFTADSDNKYGFNLKHLFNLKTAITHRFSHAIVTAIQTKTTANADFFAALPDAAFRMMNARPEVCSLVTGEMLVTYYSANNKYPGVESKCTKYMDVSMMKENVEYLPRDFYAHKLGSHLHDDAFSQLTTDHIRNFGSALKNARCAGFRFELVDEGRVKDIPVECWYGIYNRMLNHTGSAFPEIGGRWNDVNWELLKKLSLTSQFKRIYDLISKEDWSQISEDVVNKFLDTFFGCKDIPTEALVHPGLKVKPACFSLMTPEAQSTLLRHTVNLPDDIFRYLKTKDVENWSQVDDYAGGLGLLQAIAHLPNIEAIVKGLRQYDGPHPCSTIRDVDLLSKTSVLTSYMDANCFRAMKIDSISMEQFDELPKRLWALQPYEKILKMVSNWSEVEVETVTDLISGKHFCPAVSQEIISKLSKGSLQAINSDCFMDLPAKTNYPAELIQGMSPNIGRKLTIENYDEVKIQDFSDAQYAQLSEDVADENMHIARKLSSSDVAALKESRVGVLSAKFVSNLPAEAMKGVDSAEKMKAFKPSSLVKVTLDQAKNMTALEHITESQVRQLGIDIKDQSSGLYALQPILEKLSPEAQAAAKERLGESSAAISTVNVVLLAILAGTALLLPQF